MGTILMAKCDRKLMIFWLLLIVIVHPCSNVNGTNEDVESFGDFCKQWSCSKGEQSSQSHDCMTITLTKTNLFRVPNDNYFYEFGSHIHFKAEIPQFKRGFKANLTRVLLWFDSSAPVLMFDETFKENPFVFWEHREAGGNAILQGSIALNETLLSTRINGRPGDMDLEFTVWNEDRSERVWRRIFPVVVVAKKCIYQGDKLAAPATYAQFPCPCDESRGEICNTTTLEPSLINPNTTTTTTTTAVTDRVILRYCDIYGWNDEDSRDYCDEEDTITYDVTTTVAKSTDGLIIMIGVILIGLLLLMCVGLCLFQRMEAEEDRLRQKLADMEDSSTEDSSDSNSEGEEGESTSYKEHIAREGEQIATKLEILARRKSIPGDTQTFKGVITENNKITAAATKVRYQLEQLIATKEQEEGTKKRRVGEEDDVRKRVPVAPIPKKSEDPPPVLVQFPVSIEAHQETVELLGATAEPLPKSPTEGTGTVTSPGETKKSGRIAAELATLALLKETGNLTPEEFMVSKNLILYE